MRKPQSHDQKDAPALSVHFLAGDDCDDCDGCGYGRSCRVWKANLHLLWALKRQARRKPDTAKTSESNCPLNGPLLLCPRQIVPNRPTASSTHLTKVFLTQSAHLDILSSLLLADISHKSVTVWVK